MAGGRAHRGHGALDTLGLFERYTGTLVSDDYNGRRTSKGDKHPAWVLAQRFHYKIDLILHPLRALTTA